jgi:hypothetical protein
MAEAMPKVALTSTGALAFGSTCPKMMRRDGMPSARAACTYSSPLCFKNSARTSLATPVQLVTPMMIMTWKMLRFSINAASVRIRKNVGKQIITSISRLSNVSTLPPK